jgi:uncharacterized membrane protein
METKIPHYHQHHHLLIPHRMDRRHDDDGNGNELGSAGTPATAAAATATTTTATAARNGSIYLQEDDDEEDAATSFSSGSGGSRLRLRSLPPTPEGNEEDCDSELLELNDEDDEDSDDDEEAARQQPKGLKAASSSKSKSKSKALPVLSKKKKKAKRSVANRRGRSRGYLHLSDDQNRYVEALLAQEETLRHVRIVDTSVVLAGILCLVPVLRAALAAPAGSTGWHFYQGVGNQLAVAAVTEVSLAMLYDTHSSLLAFVGRLTLSVKLLNWIWIMFVISLPVGSILVSSSPSHFGYIAIIMVARFVTALLLWAVRSNPKTWKHDVAPRFPVMLRSIVDCALLVAALFVSLTTAGYLSALLVVAGPVLTRCLLAAFPGLNFD